MEISVDCVDLDSSRSTSSVMSPEIPVIDKISGLVASLRSESSRKSSKGTQGAKVNERSHSCSKKLFLEGSKGFDSNHEGQPSSDTLKRKCSDQDFSDKRSPEEKIAKPLPRGSFSFASPTVVFNHSYKVGHPDNEVPSSTGSGALQNKSNYHGESSNRDIDNTNKRLSEDPPGDVRICDTCHGTIASDAGEESDIAPSHTNSPARHNESTQEPSKDIPTKQKTNVLSTRNAPVYKMKPPFVHANLIKKKIKEVLRTERRNSDHSNFMLDGSQFMDDPDTCFFASVMPFVKMLKVGDNLLFKSFVMSKLGELVNKQDE